MGRMVWGLNPVVGTRFLHNSKLALEPILCPIQGVQCLFSGGKVARAEPSWSVVGWNFGSRGSMSIYYTGWMVWGLDPRRGKRFLVSKDYALYVAYPALCKLVPCSFPGLNWTGLKVNHWCSSGPRGSVELFLCSCYTPSWWSGIEFSGVGTVFCAPVRLALRPTQSSVQWIQGFFPGVKEPVF